MAGELPEFVAQEIEILRDSRLQNVGSMDVQISLLIRFWTYSW